MDGAARTFTTSDAEATEALGRALGMAAVPLPPGGLVLALEGELGAGKTVLVRGVAAGFGVGDDVPVASPTYVIVRVHGGPAGTLHHVDAYRLAGVEEAEEAGLAEMWGDGRLACVEWAGRLDALLPEDHLHVTITPDPPAGPDARRLQVRATGPRSKAWLARLPAQAGATP